MIYVIVYDISRDESRRKIARYLMNKGQRVQESAFECKLDEKGRRAVEKALQRLVDPEGNVRMYPLCAECYAKRIGIGQIREPRGQKGYAIF